MAKMSLRSRRKFELLAETISKNVGKFSKREAQCLIQDFHLVLQEMNFSRRSIKGLDKDQFRYVLFKFFGMNDDSMNDRVFWTFDKDKDGLVTVKEWIDGMSVFLRGTLDEKIHFCFGVYAPKGVTHITKFAMFYMLRSTISLPPRDDHDASVKDMVDMVLKMMDHDNDGQLSLQDFEKSVKQKNLLLEAFGPCLPNTASIEAFEKRVFQDEPASVALKTPWQTWQKNGK